MTARKPATQVSPTHLESTQKLRRTAPHPTSVILNEAKRSEGPLISAGGGGAEHGRPAPHRLRPRRSVVLRVAQNDFVRLAAFGRKAPARFGTSSKCRSQVGGPGTGNA